MSWTVTFSEAVTGVTTSNFSCRLGAVGVAVGDGRVGVRERLGGDRVDRLGNWDARLEIPSAGTIVDLAGNALGGPPVNGPAYTFAPQPYSLFAADASCSKTGINVGGGSNTFGATHSNGAFIVAGSNNSFGTSDAGCSPNISGKGATPSGAAGASAPSSGPNNLPFPETYNQTTVCGQPGVHTGTTFTITNSSSGIYCASSAITFGSSNVTATVTLVAPSIQFSGSSLNLTPAYGDLLAYDTSTTLGNTGITFSGGSDVVPQRDDL